MKDPAVLQSLRTVFLLEARSFVRYVVEESLPLLRDEWDTRAQDLLTAWYKETQENVRNLKFLYSREDLSAPSGSWTLEYTQYHFLGFFYLLHPLRARMESSLQKIKAELPTVSGWPEAETIVNGILRKERPYLDRVADLEASRPEEPGEGGPRRRRVSANWW